MVSFFSSVYLQAEYVTNASERRVEYPLGAGYSADAIPSATTEEEIAQDFLIFFKKFQSIFGISNHKI